MIDSEIEMKELGRKHPTNTHSKRLLTRTSHICHRRRAAGRNHQVEEYKHTHTHTYTHTCEQQLSSFKYHKKMSFKLAT